MLMYHYLAFEFDRLFLFSLNGIIRSPAAVVVVVVVAVVVVVVAAVFVVVVVAASGAN